MTARNEPLRTPPRLLVIAATAGMMIGVYLSRQQVGFAVDHDIEITNETTNENNGIKFSIEHGNHSEEFDHPADDNGQVSTGTSTTGRANSEVEADILSVTDHDNRFQLTRRFNGRRIRPRRVVEMNVTAYSPDPQSCGDYADGWTASGYSVWTNAMKLVAADTDLFPFGTLVSIPDYHAGQVVPVLDRGGRIKGNCIDVLMPTHQQAISWGRRMLDVTVWDYVDPPPIQ